MGHGEIRIGVDLGGTKIAGIALTLAGDVVASERVATPQGDYAATIQTVGELVRRLETQSGGPATVGIGMPGSISPATGRVQNANSTWLNGKSFAENIEGALERPVKLANDANCFALSEALDGAGECAGSVFGVILGTGVGGGYVRSGRLLDGPRGIGGEWGHTPLPWASEHEFPGPNCWCGRRGCMETWASGPGLAADHKREYAEDLSAEEIVLQAAQGDNKAGATLAHHASRLARGLAGVINIIDPEVIVLGGGLSQLGYLYRVLPELIAPHVFADHAQVDIRSPKWGDASGARGAARLWNN